MSVYVTSGGSGDGTDYLASGHAKTITLFTTPATTNVLYLINWTIAANATNTPTPDTDITAININGIGDLMEKGVIKAGPSTAVKISVPLWFSTSSSADYPLKYSYNYVGIIIDTN